MNGKEHANEQKNLKMAIPKRKGSSPNHQFFTYITYYILVSGRVKLIPSLLQKNGRMLLDLPVPFKRNGLVVREQKKS